MSSDFAISVRNVGKDFLLADNPVDRLKQLLRWRRRSAEKIFGALKDISFDIRRGTTVGIIGHNGSGKSTLLQIICGTLMPTRGSVVVDGRIASLLELGAGFNPEFTGRENVFMHGAILGLSSEEIALRLPAIEAFAEIGEFIHQPVKSYSSGMYVRLAFSAAIHVEPDILIVDEALSVGDVAFQHKCMARMREFMKNGTVLFVSHDMTAVTALCSEVIWLDHGQIRERGEPKLIAEHYLAHMYEKINVDYVDPIAVRKSDRELQRVTLTDLENLPSEGLDDFGSRGASVVGIAVFDEDARPASDFKAGETCYLHVTVKTREALAHPIVGFEMRDLRGNNITSSNTDFESASLAPMSAGDMLTVCFAIEWPEIASGSYAIAVAIVDGVQTQHRVLHWINSAVIVHVECPRHVMGYLRMKVSIASNQAGSSQPNRLAAP